MSKLQWWVELWGFWLEDSVNLWGFWFAWPVSWGGGWSEWLVTTSVTNPSSWAIDTAMLDAYSGVIITTTTYWVDQTIWTPTNTSAIKRFTVINKTTSTHAIKVNGNYISPWASKYFVWDWTAWTWNDWDLEWNEILNPETATRFYCPYKQTCTVTTTSVLTLDRLCLIPYITQEELIIDSMTIVWSSWWTAGTWIAIWIYESNSSDQPTNLLTSSWILPTETASWDATYTLSTDLVIPANKTIYFAYVANSASPTFRITAAWNSFNILWSGLSANPFSYLRYAMTSWWTDLPDPAPAIWSLTWTSWALCVITLWLIN